MTHLSTDILDHCAAVHRHCDEGDIDAALHRLTLAVVLRDQLRFNRMIDDFQKSLTGENVIDIKAAVRGRLA